VRLVRVAVCVCALTLAFPSLVLTQEALPQESQSASPSVAATVPRLIRISGTARDVASQPLTGSTQIAFSLYENQDDQAPAWQETQLVTLDSAGHYAVLLGGTTADGLPLAIFSGGQARWLGVRPEGQVEQSRILLLSVAYALKSADADMLGGRPASAYALAGSQIVEGSQPQSGTQASVSNFAITPLATTACAAITSDGTATVNHVAKFTTACNIENSSIFESGGNVGIGNTAPAGMLDVTGTAFVRGLFTSVGGINMAPTGAGTTTQGFVSNPLDLSASVFNTTLLRPIDYVYQWQAEPVGNDTTNTGATLNLLYGVTGDIAETGLSINKSGVITFAPGQTFPAGASGTVTSVATGAGLTGGPVTKTGTIGIATAGITNAMLATPSITVKPGTGLSGGGTVALGGTITLTNSAPSLGGTVTSVAAGTGLSGGTITSTGTLSLNTTFTDARYLLLAGGTLTGALNGTTGTFSGALKATAGTFSGLITASAGSFLPNLGAATATAGFNSNPLDLQASAFSTTTSAAVAQRFRWQAEPTGNDTANPSGSLHLLFGANGVAPAETGLSVASNGVITFATGQTFPGSGSGTVTSVAAGAGLAGGTITKTGTLSIATAGVTNAMLATPSITVTPGAGLSGGGTVALGGTITLTNSSPSSGGTVTSVATGAGLAGGTITKTGTISIANAGVSNAMLANPSITVNAGTGLSGGGTVALGSTITLTNTAPSLGGTVTSVAAGTGLSGGTITGSGTLSLNTSFTDGRYLQLAGGALTGALTGTSATFSGAFNSGALTVAGGTITGQGTATATQGFNSNPLDLLASSFNSSSSAASTQRFRWQVEPTGNDTASPAGSLHLLFGSSTVAPAETGLSIANNGLITFTSGQTFPGTGSGTVTSVAAGTGLTGGTITKTGTIGIATGGITNAMLATPSITVTAGSGLSGGGTVALGGTITLTNSAPSSGGTVTSVAAGAGLSGGTITKTGTIGIATSGVTNAMLATPSITVNAGTGLSGGGTVALGGTITLTNTAPSLGGTVTSVTAGNGLTGGTITGSGTVSLNTTFTDGRYLQLAGGALTGALTGTSATFSGAFNSGALTAAGGTITGQGTATATQGFNSNPLDLLASSFNSSTAAASTQRFRWQVEPTGNDTASPAGSLHLLFGSSTVAPAETGLSIANNGLITFAAGQTFPGTGGGTITQVNAGTGLTGGGSSGAVSLSLTKSCASGQTLIWNGTVWNCGSFGGVSGTANGMAYFAGPATVTSTVAPTNGQILIGSTGTAPTLGTLTAGSNVTITNGPGTVTISANGPAALPFFATGNAQTGVTSSATQNVTVLWGFLLPYSVTTTQITYQITTADNTANTYDIGIFNNAGALVLDLGAIAGTTFAPSAAFDTLGWAQGSTTLAPGRYYLALTTNCSTSCAALGATPNFVSFAVNASGGASSGGALPSTMTAPADAWNTGNQPTVVIH
jgi:fibronectin-binding autotransporter adhesin